MAPLLVFYSVSQWSGFFNAASPSHLLFSNSYFGVFVLFAIKIWCAWMQLLCPFHLISSGLLSQPRGALFICAHYWCEGQGVSLRLFASAYHLVSSGCFLLIARHNFPRVTFINQPWHRIREHVDPGRYGVTLIRGALFICAHFTLQFCDMLQRSFLWRLC